LVAARLAEAETAPVLRGALLSARAALHGRDDCWPYLMILRPRVVGLGLAGPGPVPGPEGSMWWAVSARRWVTERPVPAATGGETADVIPVAVAVHGDGLVLLDLARSPGMVSVHGAPGPADRLVAAMATQLTTAITGASAGTVLVAAGIPGFPGSPQLAELLTAVEQRPAGAAHDRTVLVCARPGEDEAARLAALTARDPGLLVLVAGYVPGSRWRLRVTSAGRLIAPELDIDADAAPLWPGLVRALGGRGTRLPETA
jgi:hypothetical protein